MCVLIPRRMKAAGVSIARSKVQEPINGPTRSVGRRSNQLGVDRATSAHPPLARAREAATAAAAAAARIEIEARPPRPLASTHEKKQRPGITLHEEGGILRILERNQTGGHASHIHTLAIKCCPEWRWGRIFAPWEDRRRRRRSPAKKGGTKKRRDEAKQDHATIDGYMDNSLGCVVAS